MFARTERLLLRPGWIEDAAEVQAGIDDEAIARNLVRVPWPYQLDDARTFLSLPREAAEPSFLISLRTNGAPRIIGGIGISELDDELNLGYWIARPYWGLGFATEAATAVRRIARAMGLPRLVAAHMVDNPASGRVLRKIGFRPTGRIVKRFSLARGTDVATVEYAESDEDVCIAQDKLHDQRCRFSMQDGGDPRRAIRLMAA